MAFKPSMRKSRLPEGVEVNMFPMLNLMTVLIPLLLSTASAIKIGMIELDLPPASAGSRIESTMPRENQNRLDLAVTITDQGFYLSTSVAVLSGEQDAGPSIPLLNGEYNFQELGNKLYEIKKRAIGSFNDTDEIIISAEADVTYQTLVSAMDAARAIKIGEGQWYKLFPNVQLSLGILN